MSNKKTRKASTQNVKSPVKPVQSRGFFRTYPRWLFKQFDFTHPTWGLDFNKEHLTDIFRYLSNLEGQTWGEILTTKSGRNSNTRNHPVEFSDMTKEAQSRAKYINIDEYDGLYSIAVDNKKRVWGHINDGLFYIVWIDGEHAICPASKKNT